MGEDKSRYYSFIFGTTGLIADVLTILDYIRPGERIESYQHIYKRLSPWYLSIPMTREGYAILAGFIVIYGLTATGIAWWSIIGGRPLGGRWYGITGWAAFQLVTMGIIIAIYWLAFQDVMPWSGLSIFTMFFIGSGLLSWTIYQVLSTPRVD